MFLFKTPAIIADHFRAVHSITLLSAVAAVLPSPALVFPERFLHKVLEF